MIRRRYVALLSLAMLVSIGATAIALAEDKDEGWIKLFNGKDFSGWQKFLDPKKNADPDSIWSVKDGMIVCEGSVYGYLITEKEYENYELRLQWRWGEKVTSSRNSGVFVHVSGPDKIWPKGVEAQLFAGRAGDFWLVDGFKLTVDPTRRDPKSPRHFLHLKDDVEKPIGEWNQYDITCKGDTIKLVVNGQLENEGSEAERTKGKILLQSEGAEIYFRNIELKPLKP
jgi:hypothetical protein